MTKKQIKELQDEIEQLEIDMDQALQNNDSYQVTLGQGMRLVMTCLFQMQKEILKMNGYKENCKRYQSKTRKLFETINKQNKDNI